MPDAHEMRALRCAGCGAPFENTSGNKCTFCGSLLRRPTALQSVVTRTERPEGPVSKTPPYSAWSGRNMVLFYVATAAVPLIVGLVAAGRRTTTSTRTTVVSSRGRTATPDQGHHIGRALEALPRAGGGQDLLTSIEDNGHALGLFEGGSQRLVWRAGAFTREVERATLAVDGQNAYVVDDPNITAFRLKDGTTAWQASLATGFSTSCHGCLRATKGRVLVLQKDGTLQAFDAENGQVAWTQKLAKMPSRLPVAGELLAVLSAPEGRDDRVRVDFVEPVSGKVVSTLQPSCINKAFHRPEHVNNSSPLLFSEDGSTLYTFFGFFSHCAQAWDIASGKKLWSTYLSDWSWTNPVLQGEKALYWTSNQRVIFSLSRETGKVSKLELEEEHRGSPILAMNDLLLVKAAPEWDGNKLSLLGLDATSGKQLWQFRLSGKNLSASDFLRTWTVLPLPKASSPALSLFQQLDDENVSVERINATTGVSAGRRVLPNRRSAVSRALVRDGVAWLDVQGGLDALSLESGQVAQRLR